MRSWAVILAWVGVGICPGEGDWRINKEKAQHSEECQAEVIIFLGEEGCLLNINIHNSYVKEDLALPPMSGVVPVLVEDFLPSRHKTT